MVSLSANREEVNGSLARQNNFDESSPFLSRCDSTELG
jgi:hypothetical protein